MNRRRLSIGVVVGSAAALLAVGLVVAAPPKTSEPTEKEVRKVAKGSKESLIFTPAREAAAMVFVAQNHPELKKLLKTLSSTDKAAYESAICEIFADTEALADVLAMDADLHAAALEEWRVRSRIDLLAARMRDGQPTPEQEAKIKTLVRKQVELELERRIKEVGRLEQMLERRRSDIAQKTESIDKTVQHRLNRLLGAERKTEN